MAKSKNTNPSADAVDFLERRVWSFCRSPDQFNQEELYIHPNTSFPDFKTGKVTDLSFHANGLVEPALSTDIELFATHLDKFLDAFDISPIVAPAVARSEVRKAASDTGNSMQDLLDAVVANYREN